MNGLLSITVKSENASLLGGPVPATIAVANVSRAPVAISLPYPNPNNLQFGCQCEGFAVPKKVERQEIERTTPIVVAPGATYSVTYFLNRYLKFTRPGRAIVTYQLRLLVGSKNQAGEDEYHQAGATGHFEIDLVSAAEDQLRAKLAHYRGLLSSPNRKEREGAAEALAFLDTPLSVEYLTAMLSTQNLEVVGIEALARHPSNQSRKAIVGMLSHQDSSVVAAALAAIGRLSIHVARTEAYKLLASDNPAIQWLGLDWLSKQPDKRDLQFVVPLTGSPNESVRDLAQKVAKDVAESK
jgi:hypothetical protein